MLEQSDLTFGLPKELISAVLVVAISVLIYGIIKRILKKILTFRIKHVDVRKGKTIISVSINILKYFIIIVDILIILEICGVNTSGFIASLGIVSLVAGFAAQDILKDFLAGVTILIENQYAIGDIVSINAFKGEVISLGLRSTKIRSYTGEVKIIANRTISEVINFSIAKSLANITFQVSYGSDIEKVEKVLNSLCERFPKEIPAIKKKAELWDKTNMLPSGIEYTIVAEVKYDDRYATERQMRTMIIEELKKNKIKMPYEQVVVKNA